MENVDALIAYAESLKAAGNEEAAAQVYALLPGAVESAMDQKGQDLINENAAKKLLDAAAEAEALEQDLLGGR